MDEQDGQDKKLLHAELTRSIIGCAFEVINELGSGFLESVYERAMMIALPDAGISAEAQRPIRISYRGSPLATSTLTFWLMIESSWNSKLLRPSLWSMKRKSSTT